MALIFPHSSADWLSKPLFELPKIVWSHITDTEHLLTYKRPQGDHVTISYSFWGLSEDYYVTNSSALSYESYTRSNVLPLKYTEIALRYILGGILAMAIGSISYPIGMTVELARYAHFTS